MRLRITIGVVGVLAALALAPAASAASFSTPLKLTGANGGEPSIITAPMGDVFAAGPQGSPAASTARAESVSGYPSAKLLRSLSASVRSHSRSRILIALTANPYYALNGIRPGTQASTAVRRLHAWRPAFHVGLNYWYLVPGRAAYGVLKVCHGRVQEVGSVFKSVTRGRAALRVQHERGLSEGLSWRQRIGLGDRVDAGRPRDARDALNVETVTESNATGRRRTTRL